jgi:NAD(P)-dependent dehydrogenase (short-subunit alcohol dehydrogenase family)
LSLCITSKNRYFDCTVKENVNTLCHVKVLRQESTDLINISIGMASILRYMSLTNWHLSLHDSLFVSEAFQKTIETFGTLDIVVNNAGIFDDIQWEKEVDINLVGHRYLYCTSIHICLQTKGQR